MKQQNTHLSKAKGFTLVEIMLFLSLSSIILLGIILATGVSISRQRYADSANDLADFLRGIYYSVKDVEHQGGGASGEAIYGKFVTFREKNNNTNKIRVYDIYGDAVSIAAFNYSRDTTAILTETAKVRLKRTDDEGNPTYVEHIIPWDAVIDKPNTSGASASYSCIKQADDCFTGAIMIVRMPSSGRIKTLVSEAQFNPDSTLIDYINSSLQIKQLDFCIDSEDNSFANRRNIRLEADGTNSSAVYMVEQDDESKSKCIGVAR